MPMAALTADLGRFVSEPTLPVIPAEGGAVAKTRCPGCFGVAAADARALAAAP